MSEAGGMDCQGLRRTTCAYLGQELSEQERGAYEAHLASCPACRRFLEVARVTTCKHVADFLSDYIEDELPDEERAAFERTRPYFAQTQVIDQERWQTFADFAWEHGLIDHPVNVATLLGP